MNTVNKTLIALLLVLIVAGFFRFTGVNWDTNAHLHPDERFLTMVATSLQWPTSIGNYFDTMTSPINPHNLGYSFYVYGTYPLYLTKLIAQMVHMDTYDGITIVGRLLSAYIDVITVLIVFFLAKTLVSHQQDETVKTVAPIVAAFSYALFVLPIQLSHFFTVDPFVTVFTALVLLLIINKKRGVFTGCMAAFAAGAKISGAFVVVSVLLSFALSVISPSFWSAKNIRRLAGEALLFSLGFFVTLRIIYPYLFVGWSINPIVLSNWRQLAAFTQPGTTFPPALQWSEVSAFQPFVDIVLWGLGVPFAIMLIGICIAVLSRWITSRFARPFSPSATILIIWTLLFLLYQSLQPAKPVRYFWPVYPLFALGIGIGFSLFVLPLIRKLTCTQRAILTGIIVIICFLWPISFVTLYTRPNTRIAASDWIYEAVPNTSTILWESWDDPLPLNRPGNSPSRYKTIALSVFDPDNNQKWQSISQTLATADYIVLASNRAYGGLGRAKERYQMANRYYKSLFDGSLGFIVAAQFTSRPTLPVPSLSICIRPPLASYGIAIRPIETCGTGISVIDDYADETFTVYDHAVVTILKNRDRKSADELFFRIRGQYP